jgi:hypothetical protein
VQARWGSLQEKYRVVFNKPVEQDLAFKVSLSDDAMKPADKVELFYLLSKEARRTDELDAYYQRHVALCGSNVANVLLRREDAHAAPHRTAKGPRS